jgi:hypothetical protein
MFYLSNLNMMTFNLPLPTTDKILSNVLNVINLNSNCILNFNVLL